jgi:hypothetical protein
VKDDRAAEIRASFGRYALLVALLLTLALSVGFPLLEPLSWWWTETFEARALGLEFGFMAERRAVVFSGKEWQSALVIASVSPSGVLGRAGAIGGDVVACNYHGDRVFWSALLAFREGYASEIKVVASESLDKGCEAARTLTLTANHVP